MNTSYHIAIIPMSIKPDCMERFIEIFSQNALCSRREAGVVKFEVLQSKSDNNEFLVVEVYKTPDDQLRHRDTPHFKAFKRDVAELLVVPYTVSTYEQLSI